MVLSAARRAPALKWLLVVTAVAVLLSGCGAEPGGADTGSVAATAESVTMTVGGQARSFLIRVPAHDRGELLPVIVAFHGLGSSAEEFEGYSGLTEKTDQSQFIVIFPNGSVLADGSTRAWNAGNCCNVLDAPQAEDIEFVRAILDTLPDYDGDSERVFMSGFSNGGMLTYRIACDLGDAVAGIAVVAGAYNVASCESENQIPVIIAHGTRDDFIPYDGGVSPPAVADGLDTFTNPSVFDAVQIWLTRNGCTDAYVETAVTDSVGTVKFDTCRGDGSVALFTVDEGYHEWFRQDDGFDVSDVIVSAFIGD